MKDRICPGSEDPPASQIDPWSGICTGCGQRRHIRHDGKIRRHGVNADQLADWQQRGDRAPKIVCPWCPHPLDDHDDEGCDHVIEIAGYEYICNCAQTQTEIRNYLRDKAS